MKAGFVFGLALAAMQGVVPAEAERPASMIPKARERQITSGSGGRLLTNTGVWSPDSRWIVYDTRPDAAGEVFEGTRIEAVNVETREVRVLYESRRGAKCGVVTFHPHEWRVVFIHGPEAPTPDWSYGPYHRQGVLVDWDRPGIAVPLDARDITPPFTPGALRGGSHVHVFSPDGRFVSFTYEDHVLAVGEAQATDDDGNQRNVGVSVVGRPVTVSRGHPRNHKGTAFSVLVTRTEKTPGPGTDRIRRAFEDAWVGTNGYVRSDGSRQRTALAFQGHVVTGAGNVLSEAFVVDLPDDPAQPGDGPLEGTALRRPAPPRGVVQRRLTNTEGRRFPGIQGPRHWLRSSPDGSRIALLAKDDPGVVQLWTVSPNGGEPRQVTRNASSIASCFTWSPDGRFVAHTMDDRVCVTDMSTGATHPLTEPAAGETGPRPEAVVVSPDGGKIAYVRRLPGTDGALSNQIFVAELK